MENYRLIWILIIVVLCLGTALAETSYKTGLQYIWNEPQGTVGNQIKIIGIFKNTEAQPVLAKLTSEIYYNNKLLDVVISEQVLIQPNSDVNLTIYYRPMFQGAYNLKSYTIYGQTVTQTEDSSFLILSGGTVTMGSFESIIILVGICFFAFMLHRKFNSKPMLNKNET